MSSENLFRDALELLFVIAVGGILYSAVQKLRRGEISVNKCDSCERPISRAYAQCPKCGAEQVVAR